MIFSYQKLPFLWLETSRLQKNAPLLIFSPQAGVLVLYLSLSLSRSLSLSSFIDL